VRPQDQCQVRGGKLNSFPCSAEARGDYIRAKIKEKTNNTASIRGLYGDCSKNYLYKLVVEFAFEPARFRISGMSWAPRDFGGAMSTARVRPTAIVGKLGHY